MRNSGVETVAGFMQVGIAFSGVSILVPGMKSTKDCLL